MKGIPGIVARITLGGIWIRPRTGGIIKTSLPPEGLRVGDKVNFTVGGTKDRVIAVKLREIILTPEIDYQRREELYDFDIESWTPPVWDFADETT